MVFILRSIVCGMLGSLGTDIYIWTRNKTQHTATWHKAMSNLDETLNVTRNLLRHIFSIKTTEKL